MQAINKMSFSRSFTPCISVSRLRGGTSTQETLIPATRMRHIVAAGTCLSLKCVQGICCRAVFTRFSARRTRRRFGCCDSMSHGRPAEEPLGCRHNNWFSQGALPGWLCSAQDLNATCPAGNNNGEAHRAHCSNPCFEKTVSPGGRCRRIRSVLCPGVQRRRDCSLGIRPGPEFRQSQSAQYPDAGGFSRH